MSGNAWVSVIILTTFLALVVRRVSGQRVPLSKKLLMAAIWLAIIIVLALVFERAPF